MKYNTSEEMQNNNNNFILMDVFCIDLNYIHIIYIEYIKKINDNTKILFSFKYE